MVKTLLVAVILGGLIAYFDTRPGWDDTAVTATCLFLISACATAAAGKWPWLWALAIGVWTPLANIVLAANYSAVLALVFAFAGAYSGLFTRALLGHPNSNTGETTTDRAVP